MRYFEITYEWHSRPLYRKGRLRRDAFTFAGENVTDAYKLAVEEGKKKFPRHQKSGEKPPPFRRGEESRVALKAQNVV